MERNFKENLSLTVWMYRLTDALMPVVTLYICDFFYHQRWGDNYLILGILGGLLFVTFSQLTGVYTNWQGRRLFAGFRLLLQAWVLTWLALIAITFLLKDSDQFSRATLAAWALLNPVALFLFRFLFRSYLGYLRVNGWNCRRVGIVGAGVLGQRLCKTLVSNKMLGYIPSAFFDDDPNKINHSFSGVPVVGDTRYFLNRKSDDIALDEIFITLPLRAEKRLKEILNSLADSTVTVKYIPDFFSLDLLHARISHIGGMPVFSVYDSPLNSNANKFVKRVEDIFISLLGLLLLSPILLAVLIGVKLDSPGPVFYTQKRIGWNGCPFSIYKFRSMPHDTDEKQLKWGEAKSKTATKFGSFIRKTSIDELPQLLNVLRGEMSIVGPRPERDIFVEKFRKEIPRYMQKHMVKAGITGWAQINGWRGDTSLEKRIEFDLYYIDNWSVWLDIKIIALTIFRLFWDKNAY